MTPEEFTFLDRKRLFLALCPAVCEQIETAIKKRKKASLALAGGTTPGPLYESLSNLPLEWSKVSLTLTDERWVSPEDPSSNEFLIRDTLIRRRAAGANFVGFKTNHARPAAGAATTEKRISPLTPFDICLLGMGPDGHVASLIPGAEGFDAACDPASTRKVAGLTAEGAAGSPDRMSLTMHGILSSRLVILVFMGQDKLAVFNEAKAGQGVSPVKALVGQKKVPVHTYWAP